MITVQAVKAADIGCLIEAHRPRPKAPLGIHLAIVKTVVWKIFFGINDRRHVTTLEIQSGQANGHAQNQVPVFSRHRKAHFFLHVPSFVLAAHGGKTVHLGTLDIHPDQVLRFRTPNGAFTEDRLGVKHTFRF